MYICNRFVICLFTYLVSICGQVLHAEQQRVLHRKKRTVVHDKQIELPIRHFDDKSIYQRYETSNQRLSTKDHIPDGVDDLKFNDQYFNDQWYLVRRETMLLSYLNSPQ